MKVYSSVVMVLMLVVVYSREQNRLNRAHGGAVKQELKKRLAKTKKCDGKLEQYFQRIEALEEKRKSQDEEILAMEKDLEERTAAVETKTKEAEGGVDQVDKQVKDLRIQMGSVNDAIAELRNSLMTEITLVESKVINNRNNIQGLDEQQKLISQ